MGASRRDYDRRSVQWEPLHRVTVGKFALGVHEVTRDEYLEFVVATRRYPDGRCWIEVRDQGIQVRWRLRPVGSWHSPGFEQTGDHPIVCVSWADARAYVGWLSEKTRREYRLPSEAEWEYAARAGTIGLRHELRRFPESTSPVGASVPNGFGLHDMLANVREWVEDCWHDTYDGAPVDGSAWTENNCTYRVSRGDRVIDSVGDGPWPTFSGLLAVRDASDRFMRDGEVEDGVGGFRVARTLR